MIGVRRTLSTALVVAGLLPIAYLWTRLLSRPISMLYGQAPGLTAAMQVTKYAVVLGGLCTLVAAAAITMGIALRGGGWLTKMREVLPTWLLVLPIVGLIMNALEIGTVGRVLAWLPINGLTFAVAWLGIGTLLAIAGTLWSTLTMAPEDAFVARSVKYLTWAAAPVAVATLGMMATLFIISTNAPQAAPPPGGAPGAQAGAPSASGQGAPGQTAPGQTGAGSSQTGGSTGQPGGAVGQPGSAGSPSGSGAGQAGAAGPGGGQQAMVGQYKIGGVIFIIVGLLMLVSARASRRALGADAALAAEPPETVFEFGRTIVAALAVTLVAFVLAQLVPIKVENPAETSPVTFDSPRTADLADRMCLDCHSNRSKWPWYSRVAPMSWLVTAHVEAGRNAANLSTWDEMPAQKRAREGASFARRTKNGSMPPKDYLLMHPEARLTEAEKAELAAGFEASMPPEK